jgi:cell volume regulation protein A
LRAEIDLPGRSGQDMAAYTVQPFSMAARRVLARLPLPAGATIVGVIRDGVHRDIKTVTQLAPGDYVLTLAPSEEMATLDRLFAARSRRSGRSRPDEMLGEFVLEGEANLGAVAELYGFHAPRNLLDFTVGEFLGRCLMRAPQPGHRLHIGDVEFIVRAVESGIITRVGLDLDPPPSARGRFDMLRIAAIALIEPLRRMMRRRAATPDEAAKPDGGRPGAHDA